jgi:putative Holliday junction resolvase
MRILGIDLGTKTMGLAITDNTITIVSSLLNFEFSSNNYLACINKLKVIDKEYKGEIKTIVLGYPTKMSGEKSDWTRTVEKFAASLKETFPDIEIKFQDERMTTITAVTFLKEEMGLRASQIKKIKDKMSAVVILQEYLQSIKRQN